MSHCIEYVCPSGHDRSVIPTTCPRCDAMMVREGEQPHGVALRAHPDDDPRSRWATPLFYAYVALTVWASFEGCTHYLDTKPSPATLVAMVALTVVWVRRRWLAPHAVRPSRRASTRYPSSPRVAIAAAQDGVVRIAGIGTLLAPARSLGGAPALAHRSYVRLGGPPIGLRPVSEPPLLAGAGEICVQDGSGVNALVCTEWVEIAAGVAANGDLIVPPGAAIEVVGHARRVPVPGVMNDDYRSMREVLEFEGTPAQPVVIRVIDPKELATAPTTNIRVSVDRDAETPPCEALEPSAAARGAHRSVRG